ncbi:MAG: hypothetical protein MUF58_19260 [Arcicella sp.]|jgi:hypothetical protein|nr:hypothetical protein [Arcicella sp.]
MKNVVTIVSLFLCIALTNNVLAMGFPHNLLAGRKGVKKEKIHHTVQNNIPKKVIMLKDGRFSQVGKKVLVYFFSHRI